MPQEWSERTFATWYRAHCQLLELATLKGDAEHRDHKEVIAASERPNGSMNVSRYARMAEARCAFYIAELDGSS